MLHHQGRPSWWNMHWQRSIYQGRGREDANIPPHPTPTYCQRSIMLHHQGRPSWWNMRWQRSIYQGRGREDVNIPPHPTPPQHTVNIASCCIIKVVPVGGTCVDNVVYIKDVVVRTFISHPTPYIYIYIYKTQKCAKTHRPPVTAWATTESPTHHNHHKTKCPKAAQAHGHQQSSANATATGLLSECHGVDVRTGAEEGHSKSISLKGPANWTVQA